MWNLINLHIQCVAKVKRVEVIYQEHFLCTLFSQCFSEECSLSVVSWWKSYAIIGRFRWWSPSSLQAIITGAISSDAFVCSPRDCCLWFFCGLLFGVRSFIASISRSLTLRARSCALSWILGELEIGEQSACASVKTYRSCRGVMMNGWNLFL